MFVTRKSGAEVLILHRSAVQGGYWHVVAGGVEPGETTTAAAERELREETGLVATPEAGVEVVEYVYALTEEPADRRNQYDPSVAQVNVTCFHVTAPDEWDRASTGNTTITAGATPARRSGPCVGRLRPRPFETSYHTRRD